VSYFHRSILVLVVLAACGDNRDTPGNPDGGVPDAGDGCTVLELGAQDFQLNLFGQLTGVRYAVTPEIGGPLPESLLIELYDSTTKGLPPLATGTFTLGVAPNDDLATCQHCVWIPVDWDGVSPLTSVLLATEGTITLTQVDDPLSPVIAGTTSEIVLREATIDETGASTLVDGGRCVRAPAITFDTSPTPGQACLSAEDCGNPLLEVCSPASRTCGPPECGDFQGCPGDRPVCLSQYGQLFEGACYAACDPAAAQCDPGQVCRQLGVDPTFGICLLPGDGDLGEACPLEDIATSCLPGMTCSVEDTVCTRTCSYFDADPGCQPDHACTVLGVCDPLTSGSAASFGEACGDGSLLAQGCAADGGAFRGICFAYLDSQPLVCEEACLGDLGCEPEEFCALRFSSGLGICLPDPVCGDGDLGEIGEVCDDGDNDSGDGCSGDCQTVEYDVICPAAPLLAVGDTAGDTATAWDGFQASCQLGLARAEVYRFAPPGRGRLRLTVDSPTLQVMSVRAACEDAGTEQACVSNDTFGAAEVIHQITDVAELTVLVSAFTVLEQGPFTLHTEFVAESCGDGIVAGLEVCDDGNLDSDDGCRGDCGAIEYDYYCEHAAVLTTTVTGDNTGGPRVHDAPCSNDIYGSGPDRLYRYTAPASGTARFRLEQGNADLTLAVYDGCGAPPAMTALGCSSVYGVEEVEVPVTGGQTLTVLVEGFGPDAAGPFTLSVELLP
jgi:cysteine-rich repeat protein